MRGALAPPGLFDTACRGWAKPSVGLKVCWGTWEHCVHVLTYAAIVFHAMVVCVCLAQGVRDLLLWFVIGGVPGLCVRIALLDCFMPIILIVRAVVFGVCKLFHAL